MSVFFDVITCHPALPSLEAAPKLLLCCSYPYPWKRLPKKTWARSQSRRSSVLSSISLFQEKFHIGIRDYSDCLSLEIQKRRRSLTTVYVSQQQTSSDTAPDAAAQYGRIELSKGLRERGFGFGNIKGAQSAAQAGQRRARLHRVHVRLGGRPGHQRGALPNFLLSRSRSM